MAVTTDTIVVPWWKGMWKSGNKSVMRDWADEFGILPTLYAAAD